MTLVLFSQRWYRFPVIYITSNKECLDFLACFVSDVCPRSCVATSEPRRSWYALRCRSDECWKRVSLTWTGVWYPVITSSTCHLVGSYVIQTFSYQSVPDNTTAWQSREIPPKQTDLAKAHPRQFVCANWSSSRLNPCRIQKWPSPFRFCMTFIIYQYSWRTSTVWEEMKELPAQLIGCLPNKDPTCFRSLAISGGWLDSELDPRLRLVRGVTYRDLFGYI